MQLLSFPPLLINFDIDIDLSLIFTFSRKKKRNKKYVYFFPYIVLPQGSAAYSSNIQQGISLIFKNMFASLY